MRTKIGMEGWRTKLGDNMFERFYEVLTPTYERRLVTRSVWGNNFLDEKGGVDFIAWRRIRNYNVIDAKHFEKLPSGSYDVLVGSSFQEKCTLKVDRRVPYGSTSGEKEVVFKLVSGLDSITLLVMDAEADSDIGKITYKSLEAIHSSCGLLLSKKVFSSHIRFINNY